MGEEKRVNPISTLQILTRLSSDWRWAPPERRFSPH